MAEIAEDMIDGRCCSLCGCYFADVEPNKSDVPLNLTTHGYPVVCWDCWDDLSKKERRQYQRALQPTI